MLELVLQRSVDSLRYQVRLDLAPLRASPHPDDHSLGVLPAGYQTGGEKETVVVPRLLDVVGLAR